MQQHTGSKNGPASQMEIQLNYAKHHLFLVCWGILSIGTVWFGSKQKLSTTSLLRWISFLTCWGILAVGMVWFKTKIIDDLSAQLNLYSNMWWGILAVGMVWLQFSYDISDESYTNLITILSFFLYDPVFLSLTFSVWILSHLIRQPC